MTAPDVALPWSKEHGGPIAPVSNASTRFYAMIWSTAWNKTAC